MPNNYKNKVVYNGATLIDLSGDTVTSADHIMSGYIGHLADGSQVTGTGSGGSSSGQTKTGTVTGDGTTTLQIPCSFKPDLIYVYGDMSDAVSNRGVTFVTIIKDELIDIHSDASSSADSESLIYVSHDVTGYNENDSSNPHASYSNGTLTIDMVANSTSTRFRSGQVYTYELSTVGTGSGGSANLGTKAITANGTYDAEDDSLDGYSEVTVNVPDPADYTSASTALGISKPMTSGIEALTTYANGVTGESDTNLSDAVYSLAQGYGSGGDYVAADFADKTKPTGAVTFLQSSFPANTAYFTERTGITKLYAPNFTTTGNLSNLFRGMTALQYAIFPNCERFYNTCFYGCTNLVAIDCKGGTTGSSTVFMNCSKLKTIILRKSDGIAALNSANAFNGTPFASGKSGGTIYIPKALYDHLGDGTSLDYKAATNWSTYNGYGTITWAKIEGSQYETHYADGTEIPTS